MAERLRVSVREIDFSGVADGLTVTVSAGVASSSAAGTAEELLAAADAALYGAKRAGRDRVRAAANGAPQHAPRPT